MREELITHLAQITGVTNWNSINFGIMPNEDPKGFIFLASSQVVSRVRKQYQWGCAIAVSAETLNDISDKCLEFSDLISNAFKNSVTCVPGVGSIELSGSIDIESPQSYPHQGNISQTTGFFTAITFILEIK